MQAMTANNAHTAICDIIRFYFRNELTYFQVRHCMCQNVRALISVILPIGTNAMWKRIRDCICSWLSEHRQCAARTTVQCVDKRHQTIGNIECTPQQKPIINYGPALNTSNLFIIYLWICDVRAQCSPDFFSIFFSLQLCLWWVSMMYGLHFWRGGRLQMKIICTMSEVWINLN